MMVNNKLLQNPMCKALHAFFAHDSEGQQFELGSAGQTGVILQLQSVAVLAGDCLVCDGL